MEFGDRIKYLREERNIPQKDLAKQIGVSNVTLSQYENNVRRPDLSTLRVIAEYFDVSADYLLGSTNIRNAEHNKSSEFLEEFPEGVDVLRRGTRELSPKAREVMIKHMNQFIDDIKELDEK